MTSVADVNPSRGKATALSLRLYVAGDGPNSVLARSNLESILSRHCHGRHDLEVVDCLQDPQRALRDGVLVTPTLVRLSPKPEQLIVGTLSDTGSVMTALQIRVHDETGPAANGGRTPMASEEQS